MERPIDLILAAFKWILDILLNSSSDGLSECFDRVHWSGVPRSFVGVSIESERLWGSEGICGWSSIASVQVIGVVVRMSAIMVNRLGPFVSDITGRSSCSI
jgi:hypothetical protein